MDWPFLIFILHLTGVPTSCRVNEFVCGREGGGKESCYSLGNPGRRGCFVGKLLLVAAAFVVISFFPFSLVALCGARSWWHFDLTPFRMGTEVWGPFLPHWCERTDFLTTVHWCSEKEGYKWPARPYFFSFTPRPSELHPAGLAKVQVYILQGTCYIWGRWSKCTWGIRWWCWRSLFPNM